MINLLDLKSFNSNTLKPIQHMQSQMATLRSISSQFALDMPMRKAIREYNEFMKPFHEIAAAYRETKDAYDEIVGPYNEFAKSFREIARMNLPNEHELKMVRSVLDSAAVPYREFSALQRSLEVELKPLLESAQLFRRIQNDFLVPEGLIEQWRHSLPSIVPINATEIVGETSDEQNRTSEKPCAELIIAAAIIDEKGIRPEGQLIEVCSFPWFEIVAAVKKDPNFLYHFTKYPRKFEEFLAATYKKSGCPEVVLTPASGDGGRDVIASWPGMGAIRIYDQAKAYAPNRKVPANDVRAILGVLTRDQNVSKAIVTTTSSFAPGVAREFQELVPFRMELRDGKELLRWLLGLAGFSV